MSDVSRRRFLEMGVMSAAAVASPLGCAAGSAGTASTLPRIRSDADVERLLPALSNWGRWGEDDRLGTLNFITEDRRAAAAQAVRSGKVISLARVTRIEDVERGSYEVDVRTMGARDYLSMVYHGYEMTHLDALGHVFADELRLYNGYPKSNVTKEGVRKLGAELLAATGISGRGVLLDVPLVNGAPLAPGTAIMPADLDAAEKRQGISVTSGDLLFIRTGAGRGNTRQRRAGLHPECLLWLREREVALLGSDGDSDVAPLPDFERWGSPFHTIGIPYLGMPLVDNAELDALSAACSAANRWTFLATIAPLQIEGLTGSPVNPVALL